MTIRTKITLAGKSSLVHVRSVGRNFGTYAFAYVSGTRHESDIRPFGFASAAIADVIAQVERAHPTARIVETDFAA